MGRRRWLVVGVAVPGLVLGVPACSTDGPTRAEGPTATTAPPATAAGPERGADVARASVSGPITGTGASRPATAMPADLASEFGYVEEEYLITGEATAYLEAAPLGTDGRWTVAPRGSAPFTTRLLVRRPADPARFDGTVLVEWLNVTTGQDVDAFFTQAHRELLRHGSAWVGVSAQRVGVDGTGVAMPTPGLTPTPLKVADPERYGALVHPGDDYGYDVFSQAAAVLRRRDGGVDPLAGLPVRHLIAVGESQSAARLVTYVNAVHPIAEVYDGFLIHSRSDGGALMGPTAYPAPPFVHLRDDLDVPVLQFQTETDILGLDFVEARQPDTDRLRTWEVAGTAHLDRAFLDYRLWAAGAPAGVADPIAAACGAGNSGPHAAVLHRAVADLRRWVAGGPPPAPSPPIEVRDGAIVRDEFGIARGGIRTPPVDAPAAVLRGEGPIDRGYTCVLFGSTTPLDDATLAVRYPTREAYVEAVARSADAAVAAGHLLEVDAQAFVEAAREAPLASAAPSSAR